MVQMFMWALKKVSALWSVRFRASALERFCYKRFLRNSSRTKFFVHLREVSALEDVSFREVPLYSVNDILGNFSTFQADILVCLPCVNRRFSHLFCQFFGAFSLPLVCTFCSFCSVLHQPLFAVL